MAETVGMSLTPVTVIVTVAIELWLLLLSVARYVKVTSLPSDPSWIYVICVVESILTDPTLGFETTESVQVSLLSLSETVRGIATWLPSVTVAVASATVGATFCDNKIIGKIKKDRVKNNFFIFNLNI